MAPGLKTRLEAEYSIDEEVILEDVVAYAYLESTECENEASLNPHMQRHQ